MPHTPLILDNVGIKIAKDGTTATLTALECAANHIELSPDTAITTVDTFCGSTDYPGITKWSLIATLIQSFDVGSTEETLSAAVAFNNPVPFEIVPRKSVAVSATNPRWHGTVKPAPYSPINGDAGDVSTIDLEWALVTGPLKAITPGTLMAESQDYDSMTVAELQTVASERGLPTTGTKAELIARLTGA